MNEQKIVETWLMQLEAISTATMANTRKSFENNKIDPSSEYWTTAYGDVLNAISREIDLREQNLRLKVIIKLIAEMLLNIPENYRTSLQQEILEKIVAEKFVFDENLLR